MLRLSKANDWCQGRLRESRQRASLTTLYCLAKHVVQQKMSEVVNCNEDLLILQEAWQIDCPPFQGYPHNPSFLPGTAAYTPGRISGCPDGGLIKTCTPSEKISPLISI